MNNDAIPETFEYPVISITPDPRGDVQDYVANGTGSAWIQFGPISLYIVDNGSAVVLYAYPTGHCMEEPPHGATNTLVLSKSQYQEMIDGFTKEGS